MFHGESYEQRFVLKVMMEMKKVASSMIATCALLAMFTVGLGVQTAGAQHTVDGKDFPVVSPITILSPTNTTTYGSDLPSLNVTSKFLNDQKFANMTYSIDGGENCSLPLTSILEPINATVTYPNGTIRYQPSMFSPHILGGYADLPRLLEGPHNITVYATYQFSYIIGLDNATVFFTIDDGRPPAITSLLGNSTLSEGGAFTLDFTVDEQTSWMGYSLDNQENETIVGNTTLNGLNVGSHILTVYANDTAGNMGRSDVVFFEEEILPISTPSTTPQVTLKPVRSVIPTSEPFHPADWSFPVQIVLLVVLVVVFGLGFLVFIKKYR